MTAKTMAVRIINSIEECGPISFHSAMSACGAEAYGSLSLNLDGASWNGVSELFVRAMRIAGLAGVGRVTGLRSLTRVRSVESVQRAWTASRNSERGILFCRITAKSPETTPRKLQYDLNLNLRGVETLAEHCGFAWIDERWEDVAITPKVIPQPAPAKEPAPRVESYPK